MATIVVGGSQYGVACANSAGNSFDGNTNYMLHVPAKDFWSVVACDPQTRSQLQTPQPLPNRNNQRNKLLANADGSVNIYFGLEAPAGKSANWIATVPARYGPEFSGCLGR